MSLYLTLSPVLSSHIRRLRHKTHRHAAIAYYLERIAETTETIAMLADYTPPPTGELAEWIAAMSQQTKALAVAVASLSPPQPSIQ